MAAAIRRAMLAINATLIYHASTYDVDGSRMSQDKTNRRNWRWQAVSCRPAGRHLFSPPRYPPLGANKTCLINKCINIPAAHSLPLPFFFFYFFLFFVFSNERSIRFSSFFLSDRPNIFSSGGDKRSLFLLHLLHSFPRSRLIRPYLSCLKSVPVYIIDRFILTILFSFIVIIEIRERQ